MFILSIESTTWRCVSSFCIEWFVIYSVSSISMAVEHLRLRWRKPIESCFWTFSLRFHNLKFRNIPGNIFHSGFKCINTLMEESIAMQSSLKAAVTRIQDGTPFPLLSIASSLFGLNKMQNSPNVVTMRNVCIMIKTRIPLVSDFDIFVPCLCLWGVFTSRWEEVILSLRRQVSLSWISLTLVSSRLMWYERYRRHTIGNIPMIPKFNTPT